MNILGRARKMIRGMAPAEPPRPQPYTVACPEGHILRGLRTEGYQALRCPACGEGIFVLPRSPLPEPPAPPADRARKRAMAPVGAPGLDDEPIALSDPPPQIEPEADAEIEWLDPGPDAVSAETAPADGPEIDFEEPAPPPAAKPAQTRPTRPRANPADGRPRPAAARPVAAPEPAIQPKPGARRLRPQPSATEGTAVAGPTITLPDRAGLIERIRRRPLPWTLAAMTLVVAVTIGLKLYREHRQNLPRIAEVNRAEGLRALEEGEFNIAKEKLARAARALEELGDEEAGRVRQDADQAAILADLVPEPLEDLIDLAAFKSDQWPSIFRDKYQGRSIIIEGDLSASDGEDGALGVAYLIIGEGRNPQTGRLDFKGFRLFEGGAFEPGQHAIFGARLDAIRLGDRGQWRVALEPDSGVIMSDHKAMAAVPGWDRSAEDSP